MRYYGNTDEGMQELRIFDGPAIVWERRQRFTFPPKWVVSRRLVKPHYAVTELGATHGRVETETAMVFALPFSRKLHFLGESLLMMGRRIRGDLRTVLHKPVATF